MLPLTSSFPKNLSNSDLNFSKLRQSPLRRTASSPALLELEKTSPHILKKISFIPRNQTEEKTCTIEHVNVHNQKDMEQISELYRKSMLDGNNKNGFSWKINPTKAVHDILGNKTHSKAATFVIIKDDKKDIVAFGGLKKPTEFEDTQGQPIYSSKNDVELCMLHADKDKGKGCSYGRKIINALAEYAQKFNMNDIVLHVTQTQNHAINAYKELGFKEDIRFKDVKLSPLHEKTGDASVTYKVGIGELAPIFRDTDIEEAYNAIKAKDGIREFPTLHLYVNSEELLKKFKNK